MLTITTDIIHNDKPLDSRIVNLEDSPIKLFIITKNDELLLYTYTELRQHAFYILFSNEDRANRRKFYIGQTLNAINRFKQHIAKKDFWEVACIFINKHQEFSRSEILYLEYLGIKHAIECNAYDTIKNCQLPIEPVLNTEMKNLIILYFDHIKLLLLHSGFYLYYNKVFDMGEINKQTLHNIVSRIVKEYNKQNTHSHTYYDYSEELYEEEESVVYKLIYDRLYMVSAVLLSDNKMFFLRPGFINMSNIEDDIKRKDLINTAIDNKLLDNNGRIISLNLMFDTPDDAEYFATGEISNKWLPNIVLNKTI